MLRYNRQSSAKRQALALTLDGRSLMYARNRSGPSTVPCGTPEVTGAEFDLLALYDNLLGSVRYEASNPLKGCSSDSVVFQFDQKPLMGNLIKGFGKI